MGHRDVVANLIKEVSSDALGKTVVEVGVWGGYLSSYILEKFFQELNGYYMVDPWRDVGDPLHSDSKVSSTELGWEGAWAKVCSLEEKFSPVARIMKMTSIEAVEHFPMARVDLVFIDADHRYEMVKQDIEAWWPTVRLGGILCGHDYLPESAKNQIQEHKGNMMRIFGIGYARTGTTSLEGALKLLGYNSRGGAHVNCRKGPDGSWPKFEDMYRDAFGIINNATTRTGEKYDAFADEPWCFLYKELDERYPGSKFILTVRSAKDWLESMCSYFHRHGPHREFIFGHGVPGEAKTAYLQKYIKHNVDVVDYFKDRPDDLLVFRLCDGDGWGPLCWFLDKPVPDQDFPWRNKGRA